MGKYSIFLVMLSFGCIIKEPLISCNTGECSCQDCRETCGPKPPPIVPPPPWKIFGVDGYFFIAGALFAVFVLVFGIMLIWRHLVYSHIGEPMTMKGELEDLTSNYM